VVATKRPGRTFSKSPQWGDDLDFCCGRDQKSGFADLRKQGEGGGTCDGTKAGT
jgi:hypothetical protein